MPEAARPKRTTQLGVRKSPLFFFKSHWGSSNFPIHPLRRVTWEEPHKARSSHNLHGVSKIDIKNFCECSGGKQNTTKEQPPECKILPEYEILTWYKAHCWFSHLSSMPTTLVSKIAQKPSHTDVGFKNKKSLRYGRQKALVLVGRQDPSEQKEKPKNHKH